MKFAFSSNAFLRHSLFETIEILAAIGYGGIEIMADVPHAYPRNLSGRDIAEIRRLLDKNRYGYIEHQRLHAPRGRRTRITLRGSRRTPG